MTVTNNIKRSDKVPAWQRKAWDDFMNMVLERAESRKNKKAGLAKVGMAGPAGGGES